MLVDSHCHLDRLDLEPYGGKLQGALDKAEAEGVSHFLCVCIDLEHLDDVLMPARNHRNIFASVGVHPNEYEGHDPSTEELVKLADNENVIAIGETGLDYFRSEGDLEWQRERFRKHISASKKSRKPLIIHMRDATEDTLRIMKEENAGEAGGVMHCFVEDWEVAKKALDLNFYISFSGIVTFNSAKDLKEVAKKVPVDKFLVETDSPYLAPVPFRGKPNQPAYVRHVAEHIAELRNSSLDEIGEITTDNFFTLFSHAGR
jgi:TatD DNase family protein